MSDERLINDCEKVHAGLREALELEMDGQDTTGRVEEAMAKTLAILNSVIETASETLAGCAAMARLFLALQREDLGMSLARDVAALR
jgi:hypothetical protein